MENRISLNHIVYQVLEFASSGTLSNDINITWELAAQWVSEQRAILISQSLVKKDMINDSWISYIPCVELEQVQDVDCKCETSDCYILKSKLRLPSTIDEYHDNTWVSVNTVGNQQISKSNPIRQRYQKFNKYTNNNMIYWIKDDYLYIRNNEFLDKVTMSGLLEFPEDASRFNCPGMVCYSDDLPYPVSLNLASQIVDIIIKTKLQPFLQAPADTSNNANSTTPQQTEQQKQAGK